MTRHFPGHYVLAVAGLLAAPIFSRADTTNLALAKSEILESNVAYLRVSHVAAGLPGIIGAANRALTATNKIAGTVLDLRFADGDDAAAATASANLLAAEKLPMAILVNGQTHGAAVTLATALRESRSGLIFGSVPTAVKLDISIAENPADEKKFIENPYAAPATNEIAALPGVISFLPWVDHTSEADLVRQQQQNMTRIDLINPPSPFGPARSQIHKNGDDNNNDDDSVPPSAVRPQKPVIRDPVLARAVDLIKGLAILRHQS